MVAPERSRHLQRRRRPSPTARRSTRSPGLPTRTRSAASATRPARRRRRLSSASRPTRNTPIRRRRAPCRASGSFSRDSEATADSFLVALGGGFVRKSGRVNVSNVGTRPSNVGTLPAASNRPTALGRVLPVALLALAGVALGGLGCQNDTGCAEDGTPCGGDPTGTWTLNDACRDPAFAAPLQPTYVGQPVAQARQPVAPTTSSDW